MTGWKYDLDLTQSSKTNKQCLRSRFLFIPSKYLLILPWIPFTPPSFSSDTFICLNVDSSNTSMTNLGDTVSHTNWSKLSRTFWLLNTSCTRRVLPYPPIPTIAITQNPFSNIHRMTFSVSSFNPTAWNWDRRAHDFLLLSSSEDSIYALSATLPMEKSKI